MGALEGAGSSEDLLDLQSSTSSHLAGFPSFLVVTDEKTMNANVEL